MFTIVTAAAMGLLWLLLAAYASVGALAIIIVWFVVRDVYRMITLRKERRCQADATRH